MAPITAIGELGEPAELTRVCGHLRHGGGVLGPAPDPQLEGSVLLRNGVDRAELIAHLLNSERLSGAVYLEADIHRSGAVSYLRGARRTVFRRATGRAEPSSTGTQGIAGRSRNQRQSFSGHDYGTLAQIRSGLRS